MATIRDVAREAGVSVATVSRTCNGSAAVNESTRRRVLAVAARLGYTPHGAARSLITNRTNTLGVLLPDLFGEFFSEVIRGVDEVAQGSGYHLLVSSSHDEEREIAAAFRAMRGRVDGFLVMSPDMDARAALHTLPDHFPVVLLNCPADGVDADSIVIANYGGAAAVVRHLVERGHRRIAMIAGRARNYDAAERLRAFRDTARASGLGQTDVIEVEGDFGEASGFQAASGLLRTARPPTAIFAANDSMAIGAISALREGGVRVPEDMAVAGFDDVPMARYMNPSLTTVHVDINALGARAARRLLDHVRDAPGHRHRQEVVPANLVVRRSTGSGAP